jgi:hypothetical protein
MKRRSFRSGATVALALFLALPAVAQKKKADDPPAARGATTTRSCSRRPGS